MIVAGGALTAAFGLAAYAVRGRSSVLFGPSVWRGPHSRRSVALTFDDGPTAGTWELLQVLAGHGVPATFFLCGLNAERQPELAGAVASGGHEIGNHTYSHSRLYLRSAGFVADEVQRAQEVIVATTGRTPRLFRAPYGARWFGLRAVQRRLNLLGVMWTVIGLDWKLAADRVVGRVLAGVRNGAIICLHDGRGLAPHPDIRPTLEAVRRLIPALRERGFAFETVSQLLCPTP